jgi:hypothetical protein
MTLASAPAAAPPGAVDLTGHVVELTQFQNKSDMSRWTRAHADGPGITWSVFPGPGGTMIVVEHDCDRRELSGPAPAMSAGGQP